MKKRLLIISGPQGSGNHVWSKIFALHPAVYGWKELNQTYWIGHDQEPFAECWQDTDRLKQFDWSQRDYYVTGVSCPYMNNGERTVPNLIGFAAQAMGCGIDVRFAIIGRDRNILKFQETRLRGEPTYNIATEQYQKLATWNPVYLSYELLQLYSRDYLRQLSILLEFPIDYNNAHVAEILKDDTNQKYFQPVEHHPTDDLARHTSRKWR
jgi:hypothetical protein